MTVMDADLNTSLAIAADLLADTRDPWWVISGAAAALHGVRHLPVNDVDILVSTTDAARIARKTGMDEVPKEATALFRSSTFLRYCASPLEIEVMAGFHIARGDLWNQVRFLSREEKNVCGKTVYVPSKVELADLFGQIGRAKDLSRADALRALNRKGA